MDFFPLFGSVVPKHTKYTKRKVRGRKKGIQFSYLGANISLDLEAPILGANNLFPSRRLLAPRENMKDKGIPFPNLGANILLEAPTIGANNPFLLFIIYCLYVFRIEVSVARKTLKKCLPLK